MVFITGLQSCTSGADQVPQEMLDALEKAKSRVEMYNEYIKEQKVLIQGLSQDEVNNKLDIAAAREELMQYEKELGLEQRRVNVVSGRIEGNQPLNNSIVGQKRPSELGESSKRSR